MADDKVNILLVDDQPGKLLSHEAILRDLDENLLTASSAREALELLLKNEVAVVLIDVCMPETDGFELASMIRDHPRFQQTALIFISAILLTDVDRLRGYEMGAVDYVPVPVIPEVLRAKVRIFVELYRKTRQLEQLNRDLEARVAERTAELRQAEQLRSLALAAGQMGSWEWNVSQKTGSWDQGQYTIFGVDPATFPVTAKNVQALIHPDDLARVRQAFRQVTREAKTFQMECRVRRPNGEIRCCFGTAAGRFDDKGDLIGLSGVTVDITDRKQAEERQMLLAQEVDHRARNVVAVVQSIMRLTRADSIDAYVEALDGRIKALSNAHKLLAGSRWEGADLTRLVDEEFAPYGTGDVEKVFASGPAILLPPATAQTIALALHELATNAAKYGALSTEQGHVELSWYTEPGRLQFVWTEVDGPKVTIPSRRGYGTRVLKGGIESQLGGRVNFDWHPEGLRCCFSVPYDKKEPMAAGPRERRPTEHNHVPIIAPAMPGKHVLLVEDEPLVSMMLADMLAGFGHTVDGPHSRLGDAMVAARRSDLQAGILDVNIGGDKIYAVAEVLLNRDIPFVFVTGYGAETIDSRFTHVPVLQKPIEPQKLQALLFESAGRNHSQSQMVARHGASQIAS
jgi:PAS domain S-box-containing protein